MFKINNIYTLILIITSLLVISFSLSLLLPAKGWQTDYGHLYYISMFNNNSENLFKEFFLHKGPVGILFLDIIGNFIGHGWKQSIFAYFLSIFTFSSVCLFIIKKNSNNILFYFITSIFFFTFFKNQGSHIWIDVLLNIFLLCSVIYLLNFFEYKKISSIYFSIIFLLLAVLTRIDTLIYTFPFFFVFVLFIWKEKKFNLINLKFLSINFLLVILIFYSLCLFYNFDFKDFFINNIIFNLEYGNSIDYIKFKNLGVLFHYSPNKLLVSIIFVKLLFYLINKDLINKFIKYFFITISFLQIVFFIFKLNYIYLFNFLYLIEIILIVYVFINNKNFKNYFFILAILLNYTSIFLYLYSGTIKQNHYFFVFIGYFFHFLFFLKFVFDSNFKFKKFIILIFIFLSLDQSYKLFNSVKNPIVRNSNFEFKQGISNFFYNDYSIKNNELLKIIKINNVPIICDRGWPHIFINKRSNGFMFDWWFYDSFHKKIENPKINNLINSILTKKYSDYFIIDENCIKSERFNSSKLIQKVIINSTYINEFNFFLIKYELRKLND